MVAIGGSVVRTPAVAPALLGHIARAIPALCATFLIVQMFALCAAGLILGGAVLLGFPAPLVWALTAVSTTISLWLAVVVFTRVWSVERHISGGGNPDDLPPWTLPTLR